MNLGGRRGDEGDVEVIVFLFFPFSFIFILSISLMHEAPDHQKASAGALSSSLLKLMEWYLLLPLKFENLKVVYLISFVFS